MMDSELTQIDGNKATQMLITNICFEDKQREISLVKLFAEDVIN